MQIKIIHGLPFIQDQQDYFVMELQGTFENEDDRWQDLQLGTIEIDSQNKPRLIIGNYQLSGEKTKLDKPLLLLHKQDTAPDNAEELSADIQGSGKGQRDIQVQYQSVCIVREKYLFKKRPDLVIKAQS